MPPSPSSPFSSSSPERFEEARRIEVRPRGAGQTKVPEFADQSEVVLHFSCPACLEMLASPKSAAHASIQCPACSATVMPPTVVSMVAGASKSTLPPPRKSGTQALRK